MNPHFRNDVLKFVAFAIVAGVSLYLLDSHRTNTAPPHNALSGVAAPLPEKPPAIALAEGLALRKAGKAPETDRTATIAIHGYFCIMNAIHNDKVRFTDDEWTDGGESGIYRLISYVDIPMPHGKTERRGYIAKIYLPGLGGTLTKADWSSSKPDSGVKCLDVSPF